jgi:hypothetical protein
MMILKLDEAGPDVELDVYPNVEDVTEESWYKADGVVTYRGSRQVTSKLSEMSNVRIVCAECGGL